LMFIIEFENRLLIFFQWGLNYLTWNRSARLITGESKRDERESTPRNQT
jgi:NADH dehydrogenase